MWMSLYDFSMLLFHIQYRCGHSLVCKNLWPWPYSHFPIQLITYWVFRMHTYEAWAKVFCTGEIKQLYAYLVTDEYCPLQNIPLWSYVSGSLPLQLLEASLVLQYHDAVQHCLWLSFSLHGIIKFLATGKRHKGLGWRSMWGTETPHFQLQNAVQTKPCWLAHNDAEATPECTTCPVTFNWHPAWNTHIPMQNCWFTVWPGASC